MTLQEHTTWLKKLRGEFGALRKFTYINDV